jgi:hypothetical protein
MFTAEQRDHVRQRILEVAQSDPWVTAGALACRPCCTSSLLPKPRPARPVPRTCWWSRRGEAAAETLSQLPEMRNTQVDPERIGKVMDPPVRRWTRFSIRALAGRASGCASDEERSLRSDKLRRDLSLHSRHIMKKNSSMHVSYQASFT